MDPRRLVPPLAAVTALCVLVTGMVLLGRTWSGGDGSGRQGAPDREVAPAASSEGTVMPAPHHPAAVLAGWDAARARAWGEGDAASLSALYTSGSSAGAEDVAMLRQWTGRGLRVKGLQTQVLSLSVRTQTARRLVVVVTDRVVGGRVVGPGRDVALPTDRPSTRTVVLRRLATGWRVAHVTDEPETAGTPQRSAVATTSRTSSSAKS